MGKLKEKLTKTDIWLHAIKLTDYHAYLDLKEDMQDQEIVLRKAEEKRVKIMQHSRKIAREVEAKPEFKKNLKLARKQAKEYWSSN